MTLHPGSLVLIGTLLLASCSGDDERASIPPAAEADAHPSAPPLTAPRPATTCAEAAAVGATAERFGRQLQQVSLLAPDSVLMRELRDGYAALVTPDLLERWLADADRAPGRTTRSPWPERIEVDSVAGAGPSTCRVWGHVVYFSRTEAASGGGEAGRNPVRLQLRRKGSDWFVAAYEERTPAAGPR